MSNYPMLKNFVSPLDQFLYEYEMTHPQKSLTQQKEIAKYLRIHSLRDIPQDLSQPTNLIPWDKF